MREQDTNAKKVLSLARTCPLDKLQKYLTTLENRDDISDNLRDEAYLEIIVRLSATPRTDLNEETTKQLILMKETIKEILLCELDPDYPIRKNNNQKKLHNALRDGTLLNPANIIGHIISYHRFTSLFDRKTDTYKILDKYRYSLNKIAANRQGLRATLAGESPQSIELTTFKKDSGNHQHTTPNP
jgi:hypothetical protein